MPEIPKSFINDLLERIDIVDIVGARVSLKKKGANHHACCPFHAEKTPSFTVSQPKQFFYCFGCGATGNAITFMMDYDNMPFIDAVEELAKSAGLEVPKTQTPIGKKRAKDSASLYDLLEQAAGFFQKMLREAPDKAVAVDYLKERGLTGDIASRYGVGYAPEGWNNLEKHLGKSGDTPSKALEAGLYIQNEKGNIYDRFRHRIMFPIRDRRGRTIGFGARVLKKDEMPKYLNSPETPVFHKGQALYGLYESLQAHNKLKQVVIVEGYMDVIALAQFGVDYALATLGTATTEDHLRLILKHTPNITFCFDGDRAGKQAACRALKTSLLFMDGRTQVRFLFLPTGEDPDSHIRTIGQARFEAELKNATPLSQFLLDVLNGQVDINTLEGKAHFLYLIKPYLQRIPESSFRTVLLNELCSRCALTLDQLHAQMAEPQPNNVSTPKAPSLSTTNLALSYLIQMPELAAQLTLPDKTNNTLSPVIELAQFIQANPGTTTSHIIEGYASPEQRTTFAELALTEYLITEGHLEAAQTLINQLAQQNTQQALDALIAKSKTTELSDDEKTQLRQLLHRG
jgi:DNA primase